MVSKIQRKLRNLWKFIWEDNSLISWIVNIVLAFILVKFIIYPGLGLVFGTTHPVVAVVSGSMEHDGSFDEWWSPQEKWYSNMKITKDEFKTFKFSKGFNKGDIMILRGEKAKNIDVGDVIVFRSMNSKDPIIHRVVKKTLTNNGYTFQTKGDHNSDSIYALGEDKVGEDKIIGKAIFRIPYLGWIKILAVNLIGGGM